MRRSRRVLLLAASVMSAAVAFTSEPAGAEAPQVCGHICVSSCAEGVSECAAMGCTVQFCGGTSDWCTGPNEVVGCSPL